MFPRFTILSHAANSHHGRLICPVKDESIPCFPNVPKNKQNHVDVDLIRKRSYDAEQPGRPRSKPVSVNVQAIPDSPSTRAMKEEVIVRFKFSGAVFAHGVLQGTDATVVEVSSGVQSAIEEQPAEELDLDWKLGAPNPHGVGFVGVVRVEDRVSST